MLLRISGNFGSVLVLILAHIYLILHVCVVAYCIDFLYGPGWAMAYIIANALALMPRCCLNPYLTIFDMVVPIYFWYRTGNWVPFALSLLIIALGYLFMFVVGYVFDKTSVTERKDSDDA